MIARFWVIGVLCLGMTTATAAVSAEPTPIPAESDDRAFIMGLPKAELHVHLEGTMEPELYLEMARRNGIATRYATADDVRNRLRGAHDLGSFIQIYEELVGKC